MSPLRKYKDMVFATKDSKVRKRLIEQATLPGSAYGVTPEGCHIKPVCRQAGIKHRTSNIEHSNRQLFQVPPAA